MLSLHIITFPQGYLEALRSNINKTKHQILIKHKFVSFWYTQRVNSENLHYFGVYTAAMGAFTHIWCYKNTFLMLKNFASMGDANLDFICQESFDTINYADLLK